MIRYLEYNLKNVSIIHGIDLIHSNVKDLNAFDIIQNVILSTQKATSVAKVGKLAQLKYCKVLVCTHLKH